ncbi:hypothetical protein [Paenibacillus sp. MER TA 81-3]|nr:hypothetical protein [Paenibacillus sp. MER TA 81-3]
MPPSEGRGEWSKGVVGENHRQSVSTITRKEQFVNAAESYL